MIAPSESITSLFDFSANNESLIIGACAPLSFIQQEAEKISENETYTRTGMPIHDMLRWFASTQIRNVACLGGNLVTASPISDMNPLLASMGAKLVLSKIDDDMTSISRRSVPVSEFFLKYRTVDIAPAEILEKVEVPVLGKVFDYVKPFKQARRREDDISIVTSGMRIRLVPKGDTFFIEDAALAFGGMAPTTVMAIETAKVLIGSEFSRETFAKAQACLMSEFKLPEGVPGGQAAYRMTLAASFQQKFFFTVATELKTDIETVKSSPSAFPSISLPLPHPPQLDEDEMSGLDNFLSNEKPSLSGVQTYPAPKAASGLEDEILPKVDTVQKQASALGAASVHQSGALHCTGEAVYADDIPEPPGMLHASLILSNTCGCTFEAMDTEAALKIAGVAAVVAAEDISFLGGKNVLGAIVKDETVFMPIGGKIQTVGQVLGICVAETLEAAEMGAKSVVVKYGPQEEKIIMSVDDAIAADSFYEGTRHSLQRGDISLIDNLGSSPKSLGDKKVGDIVEVSGSFNSGAQEHFYLETNSTLVVPSESDTNLTIYCSTQAATKTQNYCASSTGTPASKVVVRVKRLGGGFGGKETRR